MNAIAQDGQKIIAKIIAHIVIGDPVIELPPVDRIKTETLFKILEADGTKMFGDPFGVVKKFFAEASDTERQGVLQGCCLFADGLEHQIGSREYFDDGNESYSRAVMDWLSLLKMLYPPNTLRETSRAGEIAFMGEKARSVLDSFVAEVAPVAARSEQSFDHTAVTYVASVAERFDVRPWDQQKGYWFDKLGASLTEEIAFSHILYTGENVHEKLQEKIVSLFVREITKLAALESYRGKLDTDGPNCCDLLHRFARESDRSYRETKQSIIRKIAEALPYAEPDFRDYVIGIVGFDDFKDHHWDAMIGAAYGALPPAPSDRGQHTQPSVSGTMATSSFNRLHHA